MQSVAKKSFTDADEARSFDKARIDIVELGSAKVVRFTFEPGWRWSVCMKPIVKSEACRARHLGVAVSGRLHVRHIDGSEIEVVPGDVYVMEPGHDAWVIGGEPFVSYEFETATVRLLWKP